MAVRKSRKQFTQPEIYEEVESSSEEGKNFIPPRILQLREFHGALTAQPSNGLGNSGHLHMRNGGNSSAMEIHESESLSEIDDAEVIGYLNTKQEMRYKRILWEAMDRRFSKAKKPKQKAELQRSISVDKAAKATPKIEKKRPSSRINYDALSKLADELNQGLDRNADQEGATDIYLFSTEMDVARNSRK